VHKEIERAKTLADEHWAYIEKLLIAHGQSSHTIKECGFHYREAFAHGYKHAIHDIARDISCEFED
jgi:hypothetical protein